MAIWDDAFGFAKDKLGNVSNLLGLTDAGKGSEEAADESAARATEQAEGLSQMEPSWGDLSPELAYDENNWVLPYSYEASAYADPATIAAQQQALQQMQDWAGGGLTAADQARLQYGRMQEDQNEKANRDAILQQMEARGMGGSGASLAAQLGSDQGRANRLSMEDMAMQQAAMERALMANSQAGELSSGMRAQSYGEEQSRGNAMDEFNVGNLERAYRESEANRQTYNQQQQNDANASQQGFDNATTSTGMAVGQENADATRESSNAASERSQQTQDQAALANAITGGLAPSGSSSSSTQSNGGTSYSYDPNQYVYGRPRSS